MATLGEDELDLPRDRDRHGFALGVEVGDVEDADRATALFGSLYQLPARLDACLSNSGLVVQMILTRDREDDVLDIRLLDPDL
jgi:hypothetical protein